MVERVISPEVQRGIVAVQNAVDDFNTNHPDCDPWLSLNVRTFEFDDGVYCDPKLYVATTCMADRFCHVACNLKDYFEADDGYHLYVPLVLTEEELARIATTEAASELLARNIFFELL